MTRSRPPVRGGNAHADLSPGRLVRLRPVPEGFLLVVESPAEPA